MVSGSAPCPQDPGHSGIQGAGVSVWTVGRSVIKRRAEKAVSHDWLSPVLVSACDRSGQVAFQSVEDARSVGQNRVKCPGQVRAKSGSSSRKLSGLSAGKSRVKRPSQSHVKGGSVRGLRGTSSPRDVGARVSQVRLKLIPGPCRKPTMGEPIRRCSTRHPLGVSPVG